MHGMRFCATGLRKKNFSLEKKEAKELKRRADDAELRAAFKENWPGEQRQVQAHRQLFVISGWVDG